MKYDYSQIIFQINSWRPRNDEIFLNFINHIFKNIYKYKNNILRK